MKDTLKCPVCGELNPADAEFCQNCRSRLTPLTGPLRGENAPIQPGQIPTKKVTSELEPILPQWLRDARQRARQSDQEPGESVSEAPASPAPAGPDLLAGLASQSTDEDEDTPEWLTSLTGAASVKKKQPGAGDSNVKRVELRGGTHELSPLPPAIGATQTPSFSPHENTVPSWMAPQEDAPEHDELRDPPGRGGQSSASIFNQPPRAFGEESVQSSSDDDDWLKKLESQPFGSQPFGESSDPFGGPGTAPAAEQSASPPALESPDWLSTLQAQADAAEEARPAKPGGPAASGPDWLSNLQAQAAAAEAVQPAEPVKPQASQPDWIQAAPPASAPAAASAEIPDWLKAFGQSPAQAAPEEAPEAAAPADVPSWLRSAAPAGADPFAVPPTPPSGPAAKPFTGRLSSDAPEQPAFAPEEAPVEPGPAPTRAFADDSIENADVDSIFQSMQIPDWLAGAAPSGLLGTPDESALPPAAQPDQSIAPAELPSWVQAMRPVDTSPRPVGAGDAGTAFMESGGPFAGLEGILPVGPGFRASSKPKSHSAKLNATEEHQAQAALLEQILAAETAPVPMKAASAVSAQRTLRWLIALLLIVLVGGTTLTGTQIFALPVSVPNQTAAAIKSVESLPPDLPVLVVFDYEPSTIGELQASAAPLIDHMLVLKHPRLALLSTSPTGPALAEEFMSVTQADHHYVRGTQYVNLGFLPGGLAGVYDFAQSPTSVMPLAADLSPAWDSAPLKGVTQLSDFSAIIVLTDSAESGRVWVEQAGPFRGKAALVVVASAQAGPMLMPYYNSGQLTGLVAGINDAASVEQANSGRPGFVRRYWDAYSVALLAAVVCMLLGGLWNLAAGLQARRGEQA
jgi:hypothetical protein